MTEIEESVVKKSFSINGVLVELLDSEVCRMEVYIDRDSDRNTLYFIKNGVCIFEQIIKADCCQNEGYIEDIEFVNKKT